MDRPRHVFQIYIRTTPERLWQAITDPAFTERYFFHTRVKAHGGWRAARVPGSGGALVVDGKVLEAERPRRLVTTWAFREEPEWPTIHRRG